MGWYLRKSVKMGPVRWNLSRSGIGMSVGVRGLRVGTGPRGAYVAGGRGGLYFRQHLGSSRRGRRSSRATNHMIAGTNTLYQRGQPSQAPRTQPTTLHTDVFSPPIEYLPETQVEDFSPATADALAQHITSQRAHVSLFPWVLGVAILLNLTILSAAWPLAIITIPTSVYAVIYAYRLDRQRTHVALNYVLDQGEANAYQNLCAGLSALASVARLQRVEARQIHGDWKRNAGTTSALQLAPIAVMPPGSIRWLETNIPVWAIRWRQGNLALIFLPDRVLVEQGRRVGGTSYRELHLNVALGRFVDRGPLPNDARVVGYNWQYSNKDGGPDRRFNNNRQWPVLEVAYVSMESTSGVSLMMQASNRQAVERFVSSMRSFRPLVYPDVPALAGQTNGVRNAGQP